MTITQTVEIPADRRLIIDVPREVPAGKTILTFTPATTVPKATNKKIGMTRKELDEMLKNAHTPHSDALSGILSGIEDFTAQQIREERLAKRYPEYFK